MPPPASDKSRFEIFQELGAGGMGRVLLAWDRVRGEKVALKLLRPGFDARSLRFFQEEIRLLARLSHPNLVGVFDYFAPGTDPALEGPCFSMEYLEGSPPGPGGLFQGAEALAALLADAAAGLHYLHARNILHRDLKPSNLMRLPSGAVKILDFGLAGLGDAARGPGPLGTLAYLPPEAFRGEYGVAGDLFALGVLGYELAAGTPPYPRPLSGDLRGLPEPEPLARRRPDLPSYLGDLLHRMIALNPARRPASAGTVLRYLRQHADAAGIPELAAEALGSVFRPPWVGRDEVWREALGFCENVGAAEPGVLEIVGPTGVGRTRFLEELKWALQLEGWNYEELGPGNGLVAAPGRLLARRRDWLQGARERPTALAFADLHLWDAGALRALRDLAGLLLRGPGSLVLLFEVNTDWAAPELRELRESCAAASRRREIALEDLEPQAARAWLRAASAELGAELPEAKILAACGGRPLLLREALRDPARAGASRSFADAARERVASLGDAARRLLALIVATPEPPEAAASLALSGGDEAAFAGARLELDRGGLLRPCAPGERVLSLAHPSLRASFAAALPPELLREAHRRWLKRLEAEAAADPRPSPRAVRLADHARAAGAAEAARRWEPEAAELEESRGDYAAALRRHEGLLPSAAGGAEQVLLHAHLAHLHYLLGNFSKSLAAYDAWIRHRQDDASGLQRAKHAFYTGLVLFSAGRGDEARARLEACLKVADPERHPAHRPYQARARSLLAALAERSGDLAAARSHLQAARALAEGRPELMGETEKRLGDFACLARDYPEALDRYARAFEHFRAAGSAQSEAIALHALGMTLREQGRLAEALRKLEESLVAAERGGELLQWARYTLNLGLLRLDRAEYAAALPCLEEAAAVLNSSGTAEDRRLARLHRAAWQVYVGRSEAAARLLEGLDAERGAAGEFAAGLAYLEGEAAYFVGRYADAEAGYGRAREAAGARGSLPVLAALGEVRARLRLGRWEGRSPDGRRLLEELASLDGPFFAAWREALGLLAAEPEARGEAAFLAALGAVRACEAPEARLEIYTLLFLEFRKCRWSRLAGRLHGAMQNEWRGIRDALTEELKMDFEKNRTLSALEEQLGALLPQAAPEAAAAPPPCAPSGDAGAIPEARFRQFSAITRQIARMKGLEEILERVMDAAIELTGAERGFLLLKSEAAAESPVAGFEIRTARGLNQRSLRQEEFQLSMSAVRQAVSTGTPLLTDNAQLDARLQEKTSVMRFQLQSILVVPLELDGGVVGALYLDHRYRPQCFTGEDLALLGAFAAQAAIAVEKATLLEELRQAKQRLEGEVATQAERIEALRGELAQAREELRYEYPEIVGTSPPMMRVFQLLDHVTATAIPVWIFGESGTGKELIARCLHFNSPRKDKPFVSENVSAIPETLLESELFGHKKGAFTHADRDRAGLFEQANGGTLFLDEIADMSLAMQAKLLRVLQEGEVRPIGAPKKVKVDVRLVTASNRDLAQMVRAGKFRQDLFFRINGLTIKLPPLRERKEDIPLLVDHLVKKIARDFHLQPSEVGDGAYRALLRHSWPGNIRELEGVLRNALLFAKGRPLTAEYFALSPGFAEAGPAPAAQAEENSAERQVILDALRRHLMDKSAVAGELGVSLRTLYTRMERLKIPKKKTVLAKYLGIK